MLIEVPRPSGDKKHTARARARARAIGTATARTPVDE